MKKLQLVLTLTGLILLFNACKEKEETVEPVDEFANTSWQPTNIDANPETNPSGDFGATGTNFYYPWAACNQDDIFSFKDGKFQHNNGGTVCDSDYLSAMLASRDYSYDKDSKTITIGGFQIKVYEFSNIQLKLGFPNPLPSGPKNYVILLKKV